jgi:hypothetical protein
LKKLIVVSKYSKLESSLASLSLSRILFFRYSVDFAINELNTIPNTKSSTLSILQSSLEGFIRLK